MSYKIIKPQITSVNGAAWGHAKTSWWFWGFVVASGIELILFGNLWLLLLVMFFMMGAVNKAQESFWKSLAENNGWQYKGELDSFSEKGIMFQQGNGRRIFHLIEGEIEEQPFRLFNYQFSVGQKDREITYWYTVVAFKFNGSFPHIYLNNKSNSYSIKSGEEIPLPAEFEKNFILSGPRGYEIEVLEIFTPDILANLLDNGLARDVELAEQEMLVFIDGVMDNFEQLEKEFSKVLELEDLLDDKLDKFKFQKIGDMSYDLK